jgi:hypothetical protein
VVQDPDPRCIARGKLRNTDGEPGVIRGEFEIDAPVGRGLEIRTYFPGTGHLEVAGVELSGPFERAASPGLRPVSEKYGFDRGIPIDRFYVNQFLFAHRLAVAGDVVEVGDPDYTLRFGGGRVSSGDVLMPSPTAGATVIADLSRPESVPTERWDCFLATQVLVCMDDFRPAATSIHRALKPGGTALVTLPTLQRYHPRSIDPWPLRWAFSPLAARELFAAVFGAENVAVTTFGNAVAASAFLDGYATHELEPSRLTYSDPTCPVTIGLRVTKSHASPLAPGGVCG